MYMYIHIININGCQLCTQNKVKFVTFQEIQVHCISSVCEILLGLAWKEKPSCPTILCS